MNKKSDSRKTQLNNYATSFFLCFLEEETRKLNRATGGRAKNQQSLNQSFSLAIDHVL